MSTAAAEHCRSAFREPLHAFFYEPLHPWLLRRLSRLARRFFFLASAETDALGDFGTIGRMTIGAEPFLRAFAPVPDSPCSWLFSVASGSLCSLMRVASSDVGGLRPSGLGSASATRFATGGGKVPHFSLYDASAFAGFSRACNCLLRLAIVSWHSASFLAAADIAEVVFSFFPLFCYFFFAFIRSSTFCFTVYQVLLLTTTTLPFINSQ